MATGSALDLRDVERQLDALAKDVTGSSIEDLMHQIGETVRVAWQGNIVREGLVDSGAYRDSLQVNTVRSDDRVVRVEVASDARTEEGFPYPAVLEYGSSRLTPKPVAMRAFDRSRRAVLRTVSDRLDRKIRSRARRG